MIIFLYKQLLGEIYISNLILIIVVNVILMSSVFIYFMKNPIYSLLFLVVNYFLVGSLFIFNNMIFLGLMFMLVYIGAVSILLLFTLMLLNLKIIYYKNIYIKYFWLIISSIFFIEFLSFYFVFKSYNNIVLKEKEVYINWFKLVSNKSDLFSIGYELYITNPNFIVLSALLLLTSLVASVNIVNSLKISKKQDSYIQLKKYSKNLFN